jgi:endonuclease YncB( thermonuclease family)
MTSLPPVPAPFFFNAWVDEWHDGDTVICKVDRGDRDYSTWSVRVLGSSCNELDEPGGPEAQAEVTRRWPPGTPLVLATLKPDKYGGRHLARVVVAHPIRGSVDVATELVEDGWAMPWNGRGAPPKPSWPRVDPGSGATAHHAS